MGKNNLAKKAMLWLTEREAINYEVNVTWNNDSASEDEAAHLVE